ncbi:MAG: 4Fe-4S dicluster domain-containing protein [Atribacterota bacterium]|nr:4Fe-4S dicluster domain-containing protein [Atribacterota bacterium]
MKDELALTIRKICPEDLYEIGFASLAGLLQGTWSEYPYGISVVRKLESGIIDKIENGPTVEYYNLYNVVNDELNRKSNEIVSLCQKHGIRALAIKATVDEQELDEEYERTLRYPFSHKMVATRAGIGWIGKTDLLVTYRFGPRVRLASVLTAKAIAEPGEPVNKSYCGDCDLCVQSCPAQAATGAPWEVTIDRDRFYNPFACRKFAREISAKNIQKEISLCGICVAVCPVGK